jgi:hypothetical protein
VTGACEHGDEPSSVMEVGELTDQLEYQYLSGGHFDDVKINFL